MDARLEAFHALLLGSLRELVAKYSAKEERGSVEATSRGPAINLGEIILRNSDRDGI
jgi:hypothetical protein